MAARRCLTPFVATIAATALCVGGVLVGGVLVGTAPVGTAPVSAAPALPAEQPPPSTPSRTSSRRDVARVPYRPVMSVADDELTLYEGDEVLRTMSPASGTGVPLSRSRPPTG